MYIKCLFQRCNKPSAVFSSNWPIRLSKNVRSFPNWTLLTDQFCSTNTLKRPNRNFKLFKREASRKTSNQLFCLKNSSRLFSCNCEQFDEKICLGQGFFFAVYTIATISSYAVLVASGFAGFLHKSEEAPWSLTPWINPKRSKTWEFLSGYFNHKYFLSGVFKKM